MLTLEFCLNTGRLCERGQNETPAGDCGLKRFFMKVKKWFFIFTQLVCMQIISWIVLFSPLRVKIQSTVLPNKDQLLSVIYGDISGSGNVIKVLKYKTKTGIRVEFLEQGMDGSRRLIAKKEIPHPYNGFFEYRGNSVQLAMGDVNGDGIMEIMAPSFDRNLIAHLNVYYYDQKQGDFYKL